MRQREKLRRWGVERERGRVREKENRTKYLTSDSLPFPKKV